MPTKLNKIKNFLLTILGILFIIELVRRFMSNEETVSFDDLENKIKLGEDKLKEIDNADYKIDEILDDWNSRK